MSDSGKKYHLACTGTALETVNKHKSNGPDITLFGSCFCPFVQRAWVALEYHGIDYTYYEVDPYAKPKELLEVSPKGLVPGLRLTNFDPPRALNESTVIIDYIEDLAIGKPQTLLPPSNNAYARSLVRLQADHVNRNLIPAFYRYLQATEESAQIEGGKDFSDALQQMAANFERAIKEGETAALGLWVDGGHLSLTDVMAGPWLFRATNVLKHYRGFILPEAPQFRAYLNRLFEHPAFKATCSTEQLYLDSYERYAFNRPNTSQVANAINLGRGLP